jgi:hypothetical protein
MVSVAAGTMNAEASPATRIAYRNAAFHLAVQASRRLAARTKLIRIRTSIVIARPIPVNVGMSASSSDPVS